MEELKPNPKIPEKHLPDPKLFRVIAEGETLQRGDFSVGVDEHGLPFRFVTTRFSWGSHMTKKGEGHYFRRRDA